MNRRLMSGSRIDCLDHWRFLFQGILLLALTACGSQSVRVTATAEAEAASVAAEQAASRQGAVVESERAKAQDRQRLAEAAERERRRLAQERQAVEAAARAEAQRLAREEAERMRRERRAAIAEARSVRQEKLDRVAALEQQIDEIQAKIGLDSEKALLMQKAITAAEELLEALTDEVAKYELADESGNTREPLAKDLIAELEAKKNELVDQARGL